MKKRVARKKKKGGLVSKIATREFIRENAPRISKVSRGFYLRLNQKVEAMVSGAIRANCSRRRLTEFELI